MSTLLLVLIIGALVTSIMSIMGKCPAGVPALLCAIVLALEKLK